MFDSFERGFHLEMKKAAFAAGFSHEMVKTAILPIVAGLGIAAGMGAGVMGLAAMTKPKDQTWRGAGFTPGKMMSHMFDWATVGLGGPIKGVAAGAGLDALGGSGGKGPMAFRPPSITGSPLSQLTKKVPGVA